MIADQLNKYVWLIQTFIQAGEKGLTFGELSDKWGRSSCADDFGEAYPRRSFNNHREVIEKVFGIVIDCDRSSNRYRIHYADDVTDPDKRVSWLVNTFSVNSSLMSGKERLAERVSIEDIPSGQKYLSVIIDAMLSNQKVAIEYKKYRMETSESLNVSPYAVKEFHRRWYLIGFCLERGAVRVYSLDRIMSLVKTDESFKMPECFDVEELFSGSFGIYLPKKDDRAVTIKFKTTVNEANYVRDLPIHSSQKEIGEADGCPLFSIRVIPTDDLFIQLCGHADRLEVVEPVGIREKMGDIFASAAAIYKHK